MKTNQKQKLKLKELQINSFATNLNNASQQTIEGASISALGKWILKQTAAIVSWEVSFDAAHTVIQSALDCTNTCPLPKPPNTERTDCRHCGDSRGW